jgi:two-component system nitrogen regulation response regulator GlnG
MSAGNNRDITIPEIEITGAGQAAVGLRLTILYHPDTRRIGEVSDLPCVGAGETVPLSRLEPGFRPLRGEAAGRPLLDPYLSRSPLVLRRNGARLELTVPASGSSLSVDGELTVEACQISEAQLEHGVSLLLARRLLLFLHYTQAVDVAENSCGLVGECDSLQRIRAQIRRVSVTDTAVLLFGESGTGKELVARALHGQSERSQAPLVAVNMAAIPEELAASELFGVSRGAYTGADSDRQGYFRRAAGGTLFLDEIGACSVSVQPQLLRALQEGEIQTPGGRVERIEVRVIAATDAVLDGDASGFSLALRHRLAGFEIHLPPLRDRCEDLGRLMLHMLPELLDPGQDQDPRVSSQWACLLQDFAAYDWPGNVRELRNFCEQISTASAGTGSLSIPENIVLAVRGSPAARVPETTLAYRSAAKLSDGEVRDAMASAQWEISRAARELEISRQTLYRRIEAIPDLRVVSDISSAEIEAIYHECRGASEMAAARLQVSRAGLIRRWRALELTPDDY